MSIKVTFYKGSKKHSERIFSSREAALAADEAWSEKSSRHSTRFEETTERAAGVPAPILDANNFRAMSALRKAAQDPRILEIEGYGLDEGRVFLHLVSGHRFGDDGRQTKSVGNARELKEALADIVKSS